MKLSRLGEFALIERIRRIAPENRDVILGIGDDAACVLNKGRSCLVTTDILIEGVHFDLKWTSLFDLGYKTLAVNLSDIAAMGGIPAYLVLGLGIPNRFDSREIEEFYRGIGSLAAKNKVAVVGGDLSVAKSLFISACLIGHVPNRPVTRGGARSGNDIYVTGTLGDSALALQLLKNNKVRRATGPQKFLLARHHKPTARVALGALLAREKLATAMIDVSDGLVQDLGHICKASNIGAIIWEATLPLSPAFRALAGTNDIQHALSGGEDYELLFCARRRDRSKVENLPARVAITRIGTCVSPPVGITVVDNSGKRLSLHSKGHDHFKTDKRFTLSRASEH